MALKRLQKEWRLWGCEEEANPSMVGKLSEPIMQGEREFWTVHPSNDWYCWEAELRPSQGPLQGAHLVYWLRYPSAYPFQPPKFDSSARFVGFPVTWDEVEVGWWIFLIPASSQDGRRLKGRVAQKTAEELKICFRRDGSDEEDEEERSGGPEESVDREWWNCHDLVLGCSAEAVVHHPLLNAGGGACSCGIRDVWSPSRSFAHCLAFLRIAVEDPKDGQKPVPRDGTEEMCFCSYDDEVSSQYAHNPTAWLSKARRLFFHDRGVAPLCVVADDLEGDLLRIVCSNLAGEELLQIQTDGESTFRDLDRQICEQIPRVDGISAWKIVLPDGRCADDVTESAVVNAEGSYRGLWCAILLVSAGILNLQPYF
ncbi:unnamed protein product [Symbiodinium sp. CCMP2592]|nr:unnamed protein product [Symbiodinium sp. CCMP2592]